MNALGPFDVLPYQGRTPQYFHAAFRRARTLPHRYRVDKHPDFAPNFDPEEFDCINKKAGRKLPDPITGEIRAYARGELYMPLYAAHPLVWEAARVLSWQLQVLRDDFGPLRVLSAWRPLAYNRAVESNDTSQHVVGFAADVVPLRKGVGVRTLHKGAMERMRDGEMLPGGLGLYAKPKNFLHVDWRLRNARWKGN